MSFAQFLSTLKHRNTLGRTIRFLKLFLLLLILTWKQRRFWRGFICRQPLASGFCPNQVVMPNVLLSFCPSVLRPDDISLISFKRVDDAAWVDIESAPQRSSLSLQNGFRTFKNYLKRWNAERIEAQLLLCHRSTLTFAELRKREEERQCTQKQDGRIHMDERKAEEAWLYGFPVTV